MPSTADLFVLFRNSVNADDAEPTVRLSEDGMRRALRHRQAYGVLVFETLEWFLANPRPADWPPGTGVLVKLDTNWTP